MLYSVTKILKVWVNTIPKKESCELPCNDALNFNTVIDNYFENDFSDQLGSISLDVFVPSELADKSVI